MDDSNLTREDLQRERERIAKFQGYISAGDNHVVGLKSDGTVVAVGRNERGQCNVKPWRNITSVSACATHTFGVVDNGTVQQAGKALMDYDGGYGKINLGGLFFDVISLSAGSDHIVARTKERNIAMGVDEYGQVSFIEHIAGQKWNISYHAGHGFTVGLKNNGTVVSSRKEKDFSDWQDIVSVSAYSHTVGLRVDGTVVSDSDESDISGWQNIISISAGYGFTVGLKADGTVAVDGMPWNKDGEVSKYYAIKCDFINDRIEFDVSGWRDIVAVSAGKYHIVGLKANGTVVVVGNNKDGQCNVSDWEEIGPVSEEQLARRAQRAQWKLQGLCEHCGGNKEGLFIFKKCQSCGK